MAKKGKARIQIPYKFRKLNQNARTYISRNKLHDIAPDNWRDRITWVEKHKLAKKAAKATASAPKAPKAVKRPVVDGNKSFKLSDQPKAFRESIVGKGVTKNDLLEPIVFKGKQKTGARAVFKRSGTNDVELVGFHRVNPLTEKVEFIKFSQDKKIYGKWSDLKKDFAKGGFVTEVNETQLFSGKGGLSILTKTKPKAPKKRSVSGTSGKSIIVQYETDGGLEAIQAAQRKKATGLNIERQSPIAGTGRAPDFSGRPTPKQRRAEIERVKRLRETAPKIGKLGTKTDIADAVYPKKTPRGQELEAKGLRYTTDRGQVRKGDLKVGDKVVTLQSPYYGMYWNGNKFVDRKPKQPTEAAKNIKKKRKRVFRKKGS